MVKNSDPNVLTLQVAQYIYGILYWHHCICPVMALIGTALTIKLHVLYSKFYQLQEISIQLGRPDQFPENDEKTLQNIARKQPLWPTETWYIVKGIKRYERRARNPVTFLVPYNRHKPFLIRYVDISSKVSLNNGILYKIFTRAFY